MRVLIKEIIIKNLLENSLQFYKKKLKEAKPDSKQHELWKMVINLCQNDIRVGKGTFTNTIKGELESGKKITISNGKKFELQDYIDQKAEMLIYIPVFKIIDLESNPNVNLSHQLIHEGVLIKNYTIPLKWNFKTNRDMAALQTKDGIFLISEYELKKLFNGGIDVKEGDEIVIDARGHSLFDWHPIP